MGKVVMDHAKVRWTGKRQFVGMDEWGHTVVMDSRPEYRGEGTGVRPMEIVLHGLAACTGMDVISILEKKRQDVRSFEVNVSAEQRTDQYPKIYTRIELEYVVGGYGVKPSAVERAIELSEEKYCSVSGMLGEQVSIHTTFRVVESPDAGYSVLDDEAAGPQE
jgi:putative redox protein